MLPLYRPSVSTRSSVDLDELRRELAKVVGEARVSTRTADRQIYAKDMWPRLLLATRAGAPAEFPPDVVVWPETVAELAAIVRVVAQRKIPVVPYGAGSGVAGGALAIYGGV